LATDSNGLNPKQLAFCLEWLKDRNATQAAIRAGYSIATAHSTGPRLLEHAGVKKFLAQRTALAVAESGVDVARTLKEIHNGAFFDPASCYAVDGTLLPVPQMPEVARRALASIKQVELFEWQGEGKEKRKVWIGYTKEVKFVSKEGMLTLTARNLSMLHDTVTIKDDDRVAKLQAAISRAGGVR
jgi:phage terminase small subunit